MPRRRPVSWVVAAALALPLVALTAWLIRVGAVDPQAPQPRPAGPAVVWPGLPQHWVDLPADRLEEQVDGAADALRAVLAPIGGACLSRSSPAAPQVTVQPCVGGSATRAVTVK